MKTLKDILLERLVLSKTKSSNAPVVICTEEEILLGTCVCGETTTKVGEPAKGHHGSKFESNNDEL